MLLAWAALVGMAHMLRTALTPEPPTPRPKCDTCGARFLDVRGVDQHRRATHPDPFEDERWLRRRELHTAANGETTHGY